MTNLKKFGFFHKKPNAKFELSELKREVPHNMEHNTLHYLNNGHIIRYTLGVVEDFLAPSKMIIGPPNVYTDGTWAWTADVMYYIEKYHIQLPDDFLTHMALNNWQCPQLGIINQIKLFSDYFR